MADHGTQVTDAAVKRAAGRLSRLYKEARADVEAKTKAWQAGHAKREAAYRQKLAEGKITQADFDAWLRGQVFQSQQWQARREEIDAILLNADKVAANIVNQGKLGVFAENANTMGYQIEQDLKADIGFTLYDEATVARLVRRAPKMLPPSQVYDDKAQRYYNKVMQSAITQGIIQGESIADIARRVAAKTTDASMVSALRNARTAFTGAQNAGRMEGLHQAQGLGVNVKKKWLATLDARTRDAHADLDGQVQDVDKPFDSDLGPIMFPGDPAADPGNVYNCRCTLTYVYPDYDFGTGERRDNITGEVIGGMTYNEWKHAKENGTLKDASDTKKSINDLLWLIKENGADKVFSGIWKDDVTYADYEAKKGSIPAKRQYLETKYKWAVAHGDTASADKFSKLLADLQEFETFGQGNHDILEALKHAQADFKDLVRDKNVPLGPFTPDAYSVARKNAAVWAKSPQEADNALRDRTGEVWRNATPDERDGIYEYTQSYHKYNEPLRGIEYGTNKILGVGNTDLNAGSQHNGPRLNAMTDIIDKSTYDFDMWFQRGCNYQGMDKFFQIDRSLLQGGTQQELENALLGKTVTEYGFMSMGSSKGRGFSGKPIMMNIYAPKGTKMMYVEPFSAFGTGKGKSWDGKAKQSSFGTELETILQQNTQLRITKVEKRGGTVFVDLEVVGQGAPQRWKKP